MTINLPEILRDLEIKRAALLPSDQKPYFDGLEAVRDLGLPELEVRLVGKDAERTFAPEIAAQIVGDALVTFNFARGTREVNTDENRTFVRDTTTRVVEKLSRLGDNGRGARLSDYDLSVLVEAALIEKGAYEVAKALVMQRTSFPSSQNTIPAEQMRLIRRNGQVVPWNQDKIEVAVRKAFLSMKMEADSAPQITGRVSERARGLGMTYIPIETVQDLVQEELVLGGYMKVAEDYILYRAKRMMFRASEAHTSNAPDPQFALIPVTEEDGASNFWDGEDLRKRIQFASIGLDLCLSAGEIEAELRRSIRADIRREDLNKTIVLNAKMLMERDADFSFFAGRILLTYIYEETLTWDIVRDGIGGLKEAHKKAFKAYLDYGVQIERLSPNIMSYDIERLASALDPTADLDFDYLGLQTLYDRYLITDKTGKRPRRLEAPQFFWMRVAMGLFYQEEKNKEEHVLALYTMYKSRRFCSSTPTLFNSGTLHSQLSSCFPGETLLVTSNGLQRIDSLQTGDHVLTQNGTFESVLAVASKRSLEPLMGLHLDNFLPGEAVIRPTADHRMFALRQEKIVCRRPVNAHNSTPCLTKRGQHKSCHTKPRQYAHPCDWLETGGETKGEWVPAGELRPGDYLALTYPAQEQEHSYRLLDFVDPTVYEEHEGQIGKTHQDSKRLYSSPLHAQTTTLPTHIELTPELGRFIGYYLAEGWASESHVSLTFHTAEEEYIHDVASLGKKLFGVAPKIHAATKGAWVTVSFHSRILAAFFRKEFGAQGSEKRLTITLLQASCAVVREAVVGFFRGDGGVVHKHQVAATVSNRSLSHEIALACLKLGALPIWRRAFKNHLAKADPYTVVLSTLQAPELIRAIGKDLHKLDWEHSPVSVWRIEAQRFFGEEGTAFYRLADIEIQPPSQEKVWDIQVENDPSFAAMGIVAHNCYLYKVDDSIESIMIRGIAENAFLSKWAGGLGGSWTAVRGTGSHIKGTNGESQGVIPFLKMHNDQLVAVNQCFVPGTKLFTGRGVVPIESTREGDLVLGKDGEYRRVEKVMEYEQNDALVEIDIKHSLEPLRVTAGHPIFALRGIPMELGNERAKTRILDKGKAVFDWIEAGQLQRGDYVAQVIPTEIVEVPDFTEEDARFYGMMLGDGHQTSDATEWGLCFNQESDAASLEFARNYLAERGIRWHESERGLYRQLKWGVNASKDPLFQLPITGADLYDAFRKKRIAPRLAHLPHGHALQIIRGLIDTDGNVSRGKEITFSNTSELLVEGLRYQLLRLGVPSAGKSRTRHFDHTATRSDGSEVVFKGTTTEWVVRIPAIAALAELVDCIPLTKHNWLTAGGMVFTRVQGVRPLSGVKFVYDLKVEGAESYMTTSALAHNGGKRAGSGCAYLEVWHNDIFDFLELRKNTGDERRRTHDMNTANWIPDLFMKRMEAREMWTLFRSSDVPDLHDLFGSAFEKRYTEYEKLVAEGKLAGRTVEAIELWKQMLKLIFETGHPWITFKDPCNVRSPQDHVGVVHSSNLCTEIVLNTGPEETAVCNLGSIILDNHLTVTGEIDHVKLRETIQIAVRALDNVIDINYYPTKPAETSNKRHRPIGMGVMGLQYALYKKDIPFASQEAIEFNDEFMEAVAYYAYEASSDIAAERGSYSTFKGSKWDRGMLPPDTIELLEKERGVEIKVARGGKLDWASLREKIQTQGMRNSNVLAIAPTATIANIMGTSPCIEPMYKNLFVKSNLSGDFVVLNSFLVRDLKAVSLWNTDIVDQIKYFDGDLHNIEEIPDWIKQKYLTAFQIPFEFLIDAGARRQKWIDQSQSLNLFLGTPDMKALSHMYRYAWHAGLKTTYYLRTLGASNIEKATVSLKMRETPTAAEVAAKKVFTDAEKAACSIEAMRNGEECEACQ